MLVTEIVRDGLRLAIWLDDGAESPREQDPLGHIVCWHRDYLLGDAHEYPTPLDFLYDLAGEIGLSEDKRERLYEGERMGTALQDFARRVRGGEGAPSWQDAHPLTTYVLGSDRLIIKPVFLMDHSGLILSTDAGRFAMVDSAGWDWGQVGWTYVTRQELLQDARRQRMSRALRARGEEILDAEFATYNHYVMGNCYGYVLETAEGEEIDACWGFIGAYAEVLQAMREGVSPAYAPYFDDLPD